MATIPQSLAGLSLTEKRMLLAQLLQEQAGQTTDVFPLSYGQRGLWFLHQLDPESAAYHVCYSSRIRSPLNVAAFRRAWQTLFDRHSGLRTTFEERDGVLIQRVGATLGAPLDLIDASSWSEAELHERVEAEARRPFDLERGPLVRMHLFARKPADHVLLLAVHHIIGDFWSLIVVVEEMLTLYQAECDGRPVELAPLAKQYSDFVAWQSELLAGPQGAGLWNYWERQLAGAPTVLDLPTDRPRPPRFSRRGACVSWRVASGVAQGLKALAAAEGVTLYTILLAAFQVLLGRYTGQNDFVIGSPFAGRTRPGFEGVVGYFINMLPLRADLSGNPSVRALLKRVGTTVLDALQHQEYPFALLVERLNIEREASRAPLVQVSFTLDKVHRPKEVGAWRFFLPPSGATLAAGRLQVEPYDIDERSCQSDLEMVCEDSEGSLAGMLRYNLDLFETETVRLMVEQFLTLLESIAQDPSRRISELPWLADAERRLVVEEWNDTKAEFPQDLCLHHLFERQAARTPERIALASDARSVTYAELDAWSNRLAHRLRRLGAGRDTLVALCVGRSPEMIGAILATLKVGAAYVPIEPAIPAARFQLILADTQPRAILTERAFADRLSHAAAPVIYLDDHRWEPTADEDSGPPPTDVKSTDLAYVMYTSGSTGRPKGVMIEHRAICNTMLWRQRDMQIYESDSVSYHLPYTFDPSLGVIFPTLAVGARLVLADPGEEYDPHRLLERIVREGVTVLEAPPVILRVMLDDPLLALCKKLRWVCCGGETMPPDLPARLFKLLDVDLYNLYGPTEAAIDSTWWPCRDDTDRPIIPIGRPIANAQTYVLDPNGQPVPPGVPGELYVAGAGLARGYLNNPALTAESFVANPFSETPGARMYRTGDRCRWLTHGALEFLGRLDHQVKLRGYRIELGEVESALLSHPSVREAAVVFQPSATGTSRLVAYVADDGDAGPPPAETLRRYLKDRLPDYMVPACFVALPALPRTPGGKVDRRALPAAPTDRPALNAVYVAPRTDLEQFLAALWRDVVQVDQVGSNDNFFELGGNSIQAAVLINRLQERLGQRVSVIALFDAPTVAGLAHHLLEFCPETVRELFGAVSLSNNTAIAPTVAGLGRRPAPSDLLVALQPAGSRPPLFMVHPPGGIVVCYQPLAHHMGRERPLYGIRSRGLHGEDELPGQLEEMAEEYVSAVRAVQPKGPYLLGGWSAGGLVALEMAQQLLAQGESLGMLAFLDTAPPTAQDPSAHQAGQEYGLELSLQQLEQLGPDEQLPYLWQHALRLGLIDAGIPMQVAQGILDDLKRLFHHHMVLTDNYVAAPYPGRITLFRPIEAPVSVPTPHDRGWGPLAAEVEVHPVPGQHHSMVKEPHVESLARRLEECLLKAEGPK
jgi:amino acid adenylation domain-containing protein